MTRVLAWEGCVNVRDVGGLPLEDGGETAYGVFVRADNVRGLTEAGWRALAAYGVSRIVDLRWSEELDEDPPRDLELEVVHVPLFGAVRAGDFSAKYDAYLDASDDAVDYYRWSYLQFLDEFQENFGAAVSALAHADGTAVVHCAGGKDRTGLVAALALRIAGVSPDAVADDWSISETSWAEWSLSWIADAADAVERNRRRFFSVAPRQAMMEVLAEIDRGGGARAYLGAAGAPEADLDRLRARLRGDG